MVNFAVQIAGRIAAVSALFSSSKDYCTGYLSEGEPDFSVVITQQDIALEQEKAARTNIAEGKAVQHVSAAQLELTAIQRKIAQELFTYDTVLFHGSVVAVDDAAYLFTAKSGTGKSTHTRLWREMLGQRAVMVNDDKPFLRLIGDFVLACGSPWNGKHHLGTNVQIPLKAICILERGEENTIEKIEPKDALHMLLQQSNRPVGAKLMGKYLEMIDTIANRVELFRLRCNMEPQAAVLSYQTMSQEP